jgi:helix-turn-helix protein
VPEAVLIRDALVLDHPARRAVLATIEARTDERAWTGGLAALGEQGVEEVLALLRPSARAVAASGLLPAINPTGLSYPGREPGPPATDRARTGGCRGP